MNRLDKLINEVLLEEKKKRDRCLRIADRKFDKPSAYKSGAVVRCRKGGIWKDLKEVIQEIIQEDESLHKWFKRSGPKGKEGGWVDCNAPDGDGGYKSCGRKKGETRSKYPSCRPTAAQCKTPGKGKKWGKTVKEISNPQSGKAAPYGSGFAPVKELVTDTRIICDNCGWSWPIKDGGDDLYICHKCGHDNEPTK